VPVPLTVSDAVFTVTAQSNTAHHDAMEGTEGQEAKEHCMHALQFGVVGVQIAFLARCRCGPEQSLLRGQIFDSPCCGAQRGGKVWHIGTIANFVCPALLDGLDQVDGVGRE
jgi:hypothetical protein